MTVVASFELCATDAVGWGNLPHGHGFLGWGDAQQLGRAEPEVVAVFDACAGVEGWGVEPWGDNILGWGDTIALGVGPTTNYTFEVRA